MIILLEKSGKLSDFKEDARDWPKTSPICPAYQAGKNLLRLFVSLSLF
jgi:hypothetical protein